MGVLLRYFCKKHAAAAVSLSAAGSIFTGAVKIHISHTRHNFANPNGQHLDLWVRNLQLKFQGDPTVNESGMGILLEYVL